MQFFIITTQDNAATARKAAINLSTIYDRSEIHFVVPGVDVALFARIMEDAKVTIHDEQRFSPHLNLATITQWRLSRFPGRANWYYQQFLKMSVAENNIAHQQFVIWDGDTIPYRPLRFFEDGAPCFVVHQKEFHEPYFETNKKLISIDRRAQSFRYSAISQHMPVVKAAMLRLLDRLKLNGSHDWTETIRRAIAEREGISLFSEYELYADYMISIEANYTLDVVAWYRYGRSCSLDQRMFLKLTNAFCSFERWDKRRYFRLDRWCRRWVDILRETNRKPPAFTRISASNSANKQD
jgi:Family of unknown function (DUF6492)